MIMTKKLQNAISIATNPYRNAQLILNDPKALEERRILYVDGHGDRIYSEPLSKADFEVFNLVACRFRNEFGELVK